MTTHKDTTMLERAARALCGTAGNCSLRKFQDRPCIDEETGRNAPCRASRDHLLMVGMFDQVRAILNELKHPSEGMIAAMLSKFEREHWNVEYRNGVLEQYREDFISAIDFVLNEGEGK